MFMPAVCEILVFQQSGGGCIRHRRPAGWLLVVLLRHDRIPSDSMLLQCLAKTIQRFYLRVICANSGTLSIKRLDRLKKIWIKGNWNVMVLSQSLRNLYPLLHTLDFRLLMLILCNNDNGFHALEGQFTIELMIIRLVLAAALAYDAHLVDGVLCWLLRKLSRKIATRIWTKRKLRKRIGFGRC